MKDFTISIIDKIIEDWEDNKAPFRLVMISSVKCYICGKNKQQYNQLRSRHTDDFDGLYNKKGWSFCLDCEYKVDMAEKYYNLSQNYLTYNQTQFLRDNEFKFFRVSSNKDIKPYVQDSAKVFRCTGNSLINIKNRLLVPLTWKYGVHEYQKLVYLSNLIYFNDKFFGKSFSFEPEDKISSKWLGYIDKEYNYSNGWFILLKILNDKNIPNGLVRDICIYWGGFN